MAESPLPYHYVTEGALARELHGQLPGQWKYIVLSFSNDLSMEKLQYLDTLARRHTTALVKIAAVTQANAREVDRFRHASSPSFELVSDKQLMIHTSLHVHGNHQHGGLVILDHAGRVEFWHLAQLPRDDLRQLVEKYSEGTIDYEIKSTGVLARLVVGAPFPMLTLAPIPGSGVDNLRHMQNATVVVFPAGCVSCEMNTRLEQVELLRRQVRAGPAHRFMIIVPAGDPTWAKSFDLFRRAGVSREIFMFSGQGADMDPYWSRYRRPDERPTVVETGVLGEITAIRSLDAVPSQD